MRLWERTGAPGVQTPALRLETTLGETWPPGPDAVVLGCCPAWGCFLSLFCAENKCQPHKETLDS